MRSFASRGSMRVNDVRASRRQSFAGRISHRVASGLSFAGPVEEERSGTITGTIINTLCSVIGAGVLSLPLALYLSSIVVGLGLLIFLSAFAAFSVYCLVVGCDATERYSITEVVAFALCPPQVWEEYLYNYGIAREAARAQEEGRHSGSESGTNSSSAGSHHATSGISQGVGAAEAKQQQRRHRGASRADPTVEAAGRAGGAEAFHRNPDASFPAPTTSSYVAVRDTYAREEWHRRRCRRVVTTLMEFIVFCSNYGTLVVYAKVIGDSMPPVVSTVLHTEGILVSKYFWLAAGGVIFFLLSCVRNMEELKWTSLLGFLTIFYIVAMVVYRYHTQQRYDYPHVDPSKYGEVHWMRLSMSLLQTVSTFGMALAYHYNVPYFYKELQDRRPPAMMQSISVAFPIIVACYASTGVFGYLTFGDEVASRKVGGNVVSNYGKNDLLMNIGRLGLFAHFACVFPVVSICTRRGLHRLTMIALTWAEQSALMKEAAIESGAQLTPEERGDSATTDDAAPRESSPLLHNNGAPTPGYQVFASSPPPLQGSILCHNTLDAPAPGSPPSALAASWGQSNLYASMGDPARPTSPASDEADLVDVDRDVGSPDQTTTLAIVVEAAILVATSVLIAATVSGIDFVIQLIGTLFSVFLVMVAPGMVGWSVFSPSGPYGSASAAASAAAAQGSSTSSGGGASSRYRFIRAKQLLCLVNAVIGIIVTVIGISVLVYDTVWGTPVPAV